MLDDAQLIGKVTEGLSLTQLAAFFGVHKNTIVYNLAKLNLKTMHTRPSRVVVLEDSLRLTVPLCNSYTDVCRKLQLSIHGKVISKVRSQIEALQLDTSHFKRGSEVTSSRLTFSPEYLKSLLVTGSPEDIPRPKQVKRALILEVPYICAICGLPGIWQGTPLVLQMDHINGKPWDNDLSNLRLVCPNCHTQTLNYGSKNIDKYMAQ